MTVTPSQSLPIVVVDRRDRVDFAGPWPVFTADAEPPAGWLTSELARRKSRALEVKPTVIAERRFVADPHALSLGASAFLTFAAAVGTFWSIYHGYTHAGLAFVALLVMLAVTVGLLCRSNAGADR